MPEYTNSYSTYLYRVAQQTFTNRGCGEFHGVSIRITRSDAKSLQIAVVFHKFSRSAGWKQAYIFISLFPVLVVRPSWLRRDLRQFPPSLEISRHFSGVIIDYEIQKYATCQ